MNSHFHVSLKSIKVNGRNITIYINIAGRLQVDYGEFVVDSVAHTATQTFSVKPIVTTTSKAVRVLIALTRLIHRLNLASVTYVANSL
jgi:hypothetical protein